MVQIDGGDVHDKGALPYGGVNKASVDIPRTCETESIDEVEHCFD